jgi:hypothetical protein
MHRLKRTSGSTITISIDREGSHLIEICGLNGKRVALERGVGKRSHPFAGLRPNSVYAVLVSTPHEKTRQLIKTR